MADLGQRGTSQVDQAEVPHQRHGQQQDVVGDERLTPAPRSQAGDLVPHDRVEARVAREPEHAGVRVEHRGVVLALDDGDLHVVVEGVTALRDRVGRDRENDGQRGDGPEHQDRQEEPALGASAVGAHGHALPLALGHQEDPRVPAVDEALRRGGGEGQERGRHHDGDPAPGLADGGLEEPVGRQDEGADGRGQRDGTDPSHPGGAQHEPPDPEER